MSEEQTVAVTFMPGGEQVVVEAGITISEAAAIAALPLALPCGGKGNCGNCRVIVQDGLLDEPTPAEIRLLTAAQRGQGVRLACQARVLGDAIIQVPPTSRVVGQKDLRQVQLRPVPLDANVKRFPRELPPPSLDDQRSDFRRVADALPGSGATLLASPEALRALPEALRAEDFHVSLTTVGNRLADVHPASTTPPCLGLAIDIGTSTVVVYVVDLETGQPLSTAAEHNPQIRHGADVISRVEYANTHRNGLTTLRQEITQVVNGISRLALAQIDADPRSVYEAVVVGNTCMHHLFLGLNPRHLAQAPYIPVTGQSVEARPVEVGLEINPRGNVHCLPCIAGFVGADTVAVIVAEEMTRQPYPVLAVDIGTNGEIALWSGEKLLVASCAAGPAFEGSQIERGMRAGPGAIEHVDLDPATGDLTYSTISAPTPVGICGSGLFDAMAVALESGAVQATGRMADDAAAEKLSPGIRARLTGAGNERKLMFSGDPGDGTGVYLSQKDVREIQLAKGAVRATAEMMLEYAGLRVEDLHEVLLAGAFGNYIRPASALRIGLLPALPVEKIRGVGNAAGTGAILSLISRAERNYADQVAAEAEQLELFREREFQNRFADTMMF
ncbi:MAG TPA: ASKHA domain-containing protein [Armatimonadota bacterium]|jgi:uncharacterized 2Fe-2S/4Fe-4S cluster protein (DUF4445 family)